MNYRIQDHEERTKEFIIYELSPNGEICREIAACRDRKDAENILTLLKSKEEVKK